MVYCVLLADPYDFENAESGYRIPLVLWRTYPETRWEAMISDVRGELEGRWPDYRIVPESGSRSFVIRQHTGQGMATVALITEFRQ